MIAKPIEALPAPLRAEVEQFLNERPLSPAGRLRPRIGRRGDNWLAVVGFSVEEGKVGIGATPVSALVAFNRGFGRVSDKKIPARE